MGWPAYLCMAAFITVAHISAEDQGEAVTIAAFDHTDFALSTLASKDF